MNQKAFEERAACVGRRGGTYLAAGLFCASDIEAARRNMLSQRSRYALKALLHLVGVEPGRPQSVAVIAADINVSRKFLEAILNDLKRARLVVSTRGKLGGYLLARPADQISFGEVIRLTEGPLALLPCASVNFYRRCADCPDEAQCALRRVMAEARDQVAKVLDNKSLADAAAHPAALAGAGIIAGQEAEL